MLKANVAIISSIIAMGMQFKSFYSLITKALSFEMPGTIELVRYQYPLKLLFTFTTIWKI